MKILDSTAYQILVDAKDDKKCFYRYEEAAKWIEEHDLLICSMTKEEGRLVIQAEKANGWILREVREEENEKAYDFIREFSSEFRPQISWRGRTIHEMAIHGLNLGKWKGYGYFDEDGNLMAYVDSKLRADGHIEIGIVVTDKKARGCGLAAGLLYFHRLKYAAYNLCSGTYEENKGMRRTFEKTGFVPKVFKEKETGKEYIFIRDRYHPEHPGDERFLTNSIYYICDSLTGKK